MQVYRITQIKYTDQLYASGYEGRWNQKGEKVIYTSSSRSLACLENVVHSSGELLQKAFAVMVIYFPDHIYIESINQNDLPKYWNQKARPLVCQQLGSAWYRSKKSLVLQVPSAIVAQEFNYLINVHHPDFSKIKIIDLESFPFDPRIKED